jgi:hypothetical protein
VHLSRQFVLMDQAGLLHDPALAAARMRSVLATAGIDEPPQNQRALSTTLRKG